MFHNITDTPMKTTPTLLAAAIAMTSTVAMANPTPAPRIVNGSDAATGSIPYQVLVRSVSDGLASVCGGSIISDRFILTAAHCYKEGWPTEVTVGMTNRAEPEETAQTIPARAWILHEDYVPSDDAGPDEIANDNDIALIDLESPIDLEACGEACAAISVATPDQFDMLASEGSQATITGWGSTLPLGATSDSLFPDVLQAANVSVVSCSQAPSSIPEDSITGNMFCATTPDFATDTCSGDSGGPLVVVNDSGTGYVQAGVVSWGYGCAQAGYPGVYTKVSNYADWISQKMSEAPPITPTDTDSSDVSDDRDSEDGAGGSVGWAVFALFPMYLQNRLATRKKAA